MSPARVLVNTVNTEGVMGKGIALRFKQIYPDMFRQYQELCETRKIRIGALWIYKTSHKWILNFPTKINWRNPSRLEYIESGLKKFRDDFTDLNIPSVAFPALGCGNGELNWESVRPVMEHYLGDLPANIFIHPPQAMEDFPEHRNQADITNWLRSEPKTLPFTEVWRDISLLLRRKSNFTTSVQSFSATLQDDLNSKCLTAITNTREVRFDYEELREIWSHFRSIGYLRRGLVPADVDKKLYYLMPILSELPYVDEVRLSEKVNQKDFTGLKYVASSETVQQPTLFG